MVKLFRELATKAFSIVKDEVEVSAQRATSFSRPARSRFVVGPDCTDITARRAMQSCLFLVPLTYQWLHDDQRRITTMMITVDIRDIITSYRIDTGPRKFRATPSI